ncbi:MAG TPA: phosphoesterase [Clostridiales bacterium UBA8153]|nr:phosphoesterase [Clostridiales bacterium UBA8153]
MDELVYVVSRDLLFAGSSHQGLSSSLGDFLRRCAVHGRFLPRGEVESDPSLKQIIPYVVLFDADSIFCVQRLPAQSESRLHGLLSVGIGGHINPLAGPAGFAELLAANAGRELEEELYLPSRPAITWVAWLNDDSTAVGQVHAGLVGLAGVAANGIAVREARQMQGTFVPYTGLLTLRPKFETWSQLVLDHWPSLMAAGNSPPRVQSSWPAGHHHTSEDK